MRIVLDAGHSFYTPGKRSPDDTLREWTFNNAVLLKLEKALLNYKDVSIKVVSDLSGKTDVPLNTRVKKANEFKADLYLSIHANAFGAGGFNSSSGLETFVYKKSLKDSTAIAKKVQASIVKATGLKDRGVKEGNFAVVRNTKCPSILIEGGFMTNKTELALLKNSDYQQLFADAIASAVVDHYKLKKKANAEVTKPVEKPKPAKQASVPSEEKEDKLFFVQVGAFANKTGAEAMKKKLMNDGYPVIIKEE